MEQSDSEITLEKVKRTSTAPIKEEVLQLNKRLEKMVDEYTTIYITS